MRSHTPAALAACLISFAAFAATTSFSADGSAVMMGNNKAAAVAQATRNAEVQAVSDALKKVGGSTDQSEDLLDAHRADILKSSQPGKDSVDGNIVTVHITAAVDTSALAKLAGASGKPSGGGGGGTGTGKRILILASEQLGPKEIIAWTDYAFAIGPGSASASSKTHLMQMVDESGSLEATLSGAFADAGFDVIDPKVLRGKLTKPGVEMIDLTNTQAENIAQKSDADIVLVVKGKADLQYHSALAEAGMHSGSGNVTARAIRVRDGKVLASTTQQAAKVHIDVETARILALNEAARLAASELVRKLNPE
jgi:hypothetical protein